MRGHWLNASMPNFCLEKLIFHPHFLASQPFLVSCFNSDKFRQNFRQHSDKIRTKFKQQTSDNKIQTKFRQNSDQNSDKNSDKIQTTKFRQNSDNNIQTKNQTNFRPNSDKIQTTKLSQNSDKFQTKLRQNSDNKLQTKFRQQNSDKYRIPGLGIFACSGSFEQVLFILKMKLQNAFFCFQKTLKCSSLFFFEDPLFLRMFWGQSSLFYKDGGGQGGPKIGGCVPLFIFFMDCVFRVAGFKKALL